jgi:hypothetical protein
MGIRSRKKLPWTSTESVVIERIIDRALQLCPDRSRDDVFRDISSCIMGGCRLDLSRWLEADNFNVLHDLYGIERHLNRGSFQLEDHFVPRFKLTTLG